MCIENTLVDISNESQLNKAEKLSLRLIAKDVKKLKKRIKEIEVKNKKLKRKIARVKRLQKRYADNNHCLATMGYLAKNIEQILKDE